MLGTAFRRAILLAVIATPAVAQSPSPVSVPGPSVELQGAPPSALDSAPEARDWPGFLGPHRNGKSTESGLPDVFPTAEPPLVWQAPIGTGYAAPAIGDGRLYHFARYNDNERLTCLDAATGEQRWTCEYPTAYDDMLGYNNGPRATPLIDGPHVYTFGAEGILQCVRAADGVPVWRVDTTKDFHVVKNFFGVGSTPLLWGDLLLVNVGGSPPDGPPDVYAAQGRVQADGSALVAFDKATGKVRWKTGDDLASYASPVLASVGGRDTVFVFARGGLLAIDPAKAETLARFPWRAKLLESVNASSPVVVGDEVFISETYELGSALTKFSGSDFAEVWTDRGRRRDRSMALHWNTPVEHDGYLYGSSGYHAPEAELRCVEWKTGKVLWSEPDMGRSSLLYVDGKLVCLSEDGTLRILRCTPDRYDELAKWELKADDGTPLLKYPAWSAPALARGRLYVQGANRLVCLRLIDEK